LPLKAISLSSRLSLFTGPVHKVQVLGISRRGKIDGKGDKKKNA
jgi:hypothetical protein